MQQKSDKIFVTGAGGFIGSHLVESLVALGSEVTAFVRYNSRQDTGFLKTLDPKILAKIRVVFGDIKDASAVYNAVKGHDVVFHLAALIGIPYSYKHPRDVVETNVIGTLNVLMGAMDAGVKRLVHTSTSEVYGTALSEKITESHPLQTQSPYAASKAGADKLVESFAASFGFPAVTIRPFNTYGPRQSMRAVIPTIIGQALYQKEIQIGSLKPVRDFTYVQDTVDAFLLGAMQKGVEGEVFNLGTDRDVSIGVLVEMIQEITDAKQKPVRTVEERLRPEKSEVFRLHSDFSKAKQKLKWEPKTSLEEGLKKSVEWIRNHPEQYLAHHYVV